MTLPIQFKNDARVYITYVAVLGVVIFAFIDHRISFEVMIGYFVTLNVPGAVQLRRKRDTRERRTDRIPVVHTPIMDDDETPRFPKEAGEHE